MFMLESRSKTELSDWVKQYTKELYAWAFQKTSDRELSEDLVQETFLAAAEGMASFRRESQPKTWLYGILKNKIAEHYRKFLRQGITTSLPSDDVSTFFGSNGRWNKAARPQTWEGEVENLTDLPAFNKVFDGCIEHLPATMNACIRLKFLDEKKGKQICQELGLTSTNYWQLIHRGKLHLRDCLEKYWFSPIQ
jgi:RNA polymerase sigma-70 factor (ECF subfamily)